MTNFDRVVGLMGASVVAIACASPAMAQTRTYSIPAQSAAGGVAALARQSDQQVLISARDAKGKKTREVRGEMTIEQAFAKLLAGSGLTAKRTGAGAWAVVQGGNGQATPSRAEAITSNERVRTAPSVSASTVVDARTGAALKGALVEIVETGEKTSTGDLGEFRFPGKSGSFNLRISYLGYPEYEQFVVLNDGRATTGILLADGSATNDIIVTAYQSARAQALNQERSAENTSTVVSSDLLGRFQGITISEALRRAPAISFVPNDETGDGDNIMARGLGPGFNTVTLNGLRLPVGGGAERSPSLSNILADSVSEIVINKTLLPNQDGSGTGALIDIKTKGPLDRPDVYFSITAERAEAGQHFMNENFLSGTASMKFGESRNFGLSLSAQYRERGNRSISITNNTIRFGQFLPLTDDGRTVTSLDSIDPRRRFPFEPGAPEAYPGGVAANDTLSEQKNWAITASAQWKIGSHTDLSLDFIRQESLKDVYTTSVGLTTTSGFRRLAIDDLNGEMRYAQVWENFSNPGLFARPSRSIQIQNDVKSLTTTIGLRGKSVFGKWNFDYKIGYAKAANSTPFIMSASFTVPSSINIGRDLLRPEVTSNTVNGRIVSLFSPLNEGNALLPGLTEGGYDLLNNASTMRFSRGTIGSRYGSNERKTASFGAKREFEAGILKYIEAGMFFEESRNATKSDGATELSGSAGLGDLGLSLDGSALRRIGQSNTLDLIGMPGLRAFGNGIRSNAFSQISSSFFPSSDIENKNGTLERDLAGYMQTSIDFGKLEIVGGVRAERVQTTSTTTYGPFIFDENGIFDSVFAERNLRNVKLTGSAFDLLPRVMMNYRFNENLIARFGYYNSIARPSILDLNQPPLIFLDLQPFYGPNGNRPSLTVSTSNPDLKSAVTDNFDLSLEWYQSSIGILKAGLFYKPTRRPFFASSAVTSSVVEGIDLPDDPRFQTPDLFVVFQRVENSKKAVKLWGFELSAERNLDFLPGALSGLGIYANYTYSRSTRDAVLGFGFSPTGTVTIENVPYNSQPPESGTVALTYSKYGIDGFLGYTFQSAYSSGNSSFYMDAKRASVRSLDARISYQFKMGPADATLYFEGTNLLKGPQDANLSTGSGNESLFFVTRDSYLGGRSLRAGLSARF